MIQPPRGFGENPIAIYHDPDLPPSHHYLAAYRWLGARRFGADAVVHLGKHGTLEWLPGKGLGLSAGCAPDAVLGELPLVYPFIVNDPGEGTQAKRRGARHRRRPPRAADGARRHVRRHGQAGAAARRVRHRVATWTRRRRRRVRAQIWTLVQAAAAAPRPARGRAAGRRRRSTTSSCTSTAISARSRTSQIRDGLHILGGAPAGEARVNLVLAVLRAAAGVGRRGARAARAAGRAGRATSALDEKELLAEPGAPRAAVPADADRRWPTARRVPPPTRSTCWRRWPGGSPRHGGRGLGRRRRSRRGRARCSAARGAGRRRGAGVRRRRGRAAAGPDHRRDRPHPARARRRLRPGRARRARRPAAWSTCCRPAATSTPSTPRPSRPATPGTSGRRWPTRCWPGTWPTPASTRTSVGLTVWGTSAHAHPGRRHRRDPGAAGLPSGVGRRVAPRHRLRGRAGWTSWAGRGSTSRCGSPASSGTRSRTWSRCSTTRSRAVAELDEPADANFLRAHVDADAAEHGDRRRATARIFGSKPGRVRGRACCR